MAQIPALFLPKKDTEKVQNKKPVRQKQNRKKSDGEKVSALFKGRLDGYQENSKAQLGYP